MYHRCMHGVGMAKAGQRALMRFVVLFVEHVKI